MIRALFLTLVLGAAASASATPWSLGSVVEPGTSGVSLLYRHHVREAVHVSAAFFAAERFTAEADWQRFFAPSARSFDYQIYSGIGLRGEALRDGNDLEAYELSLPLGLQWAPGALPLELFGEVGALMGPLPATYVRGRVRDGVRAAF